MRSRVLAAVLCCLALQADAPVTTGPARGSLVIVGGGKIGPEVAQVFLTLAGGPEAPIVIIPTASEKDTFTGADFDEDFLHRAGANHVTVLHTRDRSVADSEAFVQPLRQARGVWFPGGRQWRLVDAYLGTRMQHELQAVLDRGGVIGGTSAGATILGSYLVRGAREGNSIMMAKGYEQGFGFLKSAAIDQHLLTRKREKDLLPVIHAHPELLGIGLDEGTAIVVHGDLFHVVGPSKVAIYDPSYRPAANGLPYYFLTSGQKFNLRTRHIQ